MSLSSFVSIDSLNSNQPNQQKLHIVAAVQKYFDTLNEFEKDPRKIGMTSNEFHNAKDFYKNHYQHLCMVLSTNTYYVDIIEQLDTSYQSEKPKLLIEWLLQYVARKNFKNSLKELKASFNLKSNILFTLIILSLIYLFVGPLIFSLDTLLKFLISYLIPFISALLCTPGYMYFSTQTVQADQILSRAEKAYELPSSLKGFLYDEQIQEKIQASGEQSINLAP